MHPRRSQSGAALILLTTILVMGFAAVVYAALNSSLNQTARTRNANGEVLEQAKAALIGYVAREVLDQAETIPGRLPCPEPLGFAGTTNEGKAGPDCKPTNASQKTVGRFPWRTVGVDKLVDADAEPLWYAVSPNWVLDGSSTYPIINSGTLGQLTVDGISDVVAVIIAPGRALTATPNADQQTAGCSAHVQTRNDRSHVVTSTANPSHLDYLECKNADATPDTVFGTTIVHNATNPVTNDQAVYITSKDILNAIQGPVAERIQRTVAPLLNEYSQRWTASAGQFMPYATPFSPPEAALAEQSHCGPGTTTPQVREGLLPIAPNAVSGTCSSAWTAPTISGASITTTGCTTDSFSGSMTCGFRYYTLTPLAQTLGWLVSALSPPGTTANATIQAIAPRAAASFRDPVQAANVVVSPSGGATATPVMTPQTDGSASLSLQVSISTSNICTDSLLWSLTCATANSSLGWLIGGTVVNSNTVTVTVPILADPVLQGTLLKGSAAAASTAPHDLLNPQTDDTHYWFMQNEWYRYTYYAVSPGASAAGSGGDIRVNGFPAQFGNIDDKRFVLAVMGPPVTGQVRHMTAAVSQYIEGDNADTAATPRVFAYQVFSDSGNDRLAACPFAAGGVPICN